MTAPGLHVLLVTPGFPPVRGGVEEHVGQLARELVTLGVRVTVMTARRGLRRTVVEEHDGCRVVVAPAWRTTAMSVSPRLVARALSTAGDVDVLHVHSYHALAGLAVLNPRLRGRVVFTPHFHGGGHTALARLLHRGYARLGARLFGAASAVICVSDAEREALAEAVPLTRSRAEVVPNGVATEQIRAASPYAGEPPTVLSVGRLEPYKGVARVVAAMADLPAPAQLVVVGDGSQRAALVEQARRLGIEDRVRVLGPVGTDELHRWLRTARVLVSASTHEAFGMAPLEAAAAGAAVVLSDIPAHREISERYLGPAASLVDPSDRAALTAALRDRLVADEPVEVTVPSWAEVAARTRTTYERVRQGAGGPRPGPGTHPTTPQEANRVQSRRIGPLDRVWLGHWSVVAVTPVTTPSVEQLRGALRGLMEEHPDHPLVGTVDLVRARWVPVAPADREAHLARLVRVGEPVDPDALSDYTDRYRPPPDSDLVVSVVLSPTSIVVYMSHLFGDANAFTKIILGMVQADADALAALEPRVRLPLVASALTHQSREIYRGWWRRALEGLPGRSPAASPRPDPAHTSAPPPRPLVVDGAFRPAAASLVLSNAELRSITRWRNEHAKGASITAVLASRTYAGLVAEGVPVQRHGFYSLFDIRSMLPPEKSSTAANLAKSLLIEADLADPATVDEGLRLAIESRRALPALVAGSIVSGLRRDHGAGPPPTEAVLTFNSMPLLPGLESMPWAGDGPRRYYGVGYPTGPAGISVFAIRFRDRMELTASFDESLADEATVTRALGRVVN